MTTAAGAIPELIRKAATPLPYPTDDEAAFGKAFDTFAEGARVVLLGEASHGTSEFYKSRAAITKRLIDHHGFNIVAVEADWPDASTIDRYVRGRRPSESSNKDAFRRFPTWMWRNTDVQAFVEWLRQRNLTKTPEERAGFYGLDLYSLGTSIRAVIEYLDRVDPEAAKVARKRYGCLTPWIEEPHRYGGVALSKGYAPCEASVVKMLRDLLQKRLEYSAKDEEEFFDAELNARLVKDAEQYYRVMYYGSADSWNLRDSHMFDTLIRLLANKPRPGGAPAKAVVWAHNSHIGDARYTSMGINRGELNIGQLCRQKFSSEARLIGFGTHTGTVACASEWDEPMQIKRVLPSRPDSYEILAHQSGVDKFVLDLRERTTPNLALRQALMSPRLERFIGVIYLPETERWSHYSQAILPMQLDAYVWFDETKAVTPLDKDTKGKPGEEETYPFGL